MSNASAMVKPHTQWRRVILVALGLAALVALIVVAFLWPTVSSSVRSLPIAVVAPSAQINQLEAVLDERAPGVFAFRDASTRSTAIELIENRTVYGAIVFGPEPEVLTSTAASPPVAQLLAGLIPVLHAELTDTAQPQVTPHTAPNTAVTTDVVPLATTDSRGAGLAASAFPLVLGGMLGGILVSTLVVGVWRRIAAVSGYALAAGLGLSAVLQGWFGVLQGNYLVNASAITLALLAISSVIVGFVAIVGAPGVAAGPIIFLLIANPISASTQPIEFLAEPWGVVGQWFPPGAAGTLMRDLSYFPSADTRILWLVLAAWITGGLILSTIGHFRNAGGATRETLDEAAGV